MITLTTSLSSAWKKIGSIGITPQMDEYEKRKLRVFNQLNFIGIFCGLFLPVAGIFDGQDLPWIATLVAFSPALISSTVLLLNQKRKHELSRLVYFSLYPVITSLVYAVGLDVGVELFFILYGVLAVFYMQKPINGFIAFFVSIACYLLVYVFFDDYSYYVKTASFDFYVLNHCVAIIFIFFALSWIKKENNGYQSGMLQKNRALHKTNLEIEKQKEEIAKKAEQLSELNAEKNKLFSVISHDLKMPIYALRNLFRSIDHQDLPGDELKLMVPEIVKDLNYTTSLMENLLLWAKSQMQMDAIQIQGMDIAQMIDETTHLLRLQAEAKRIYIQRIPDQSVYVFADRDMLNLVLRNLVSNAIKFTPENGNIVIETADLGADIEVSIRDTGVGMTRDILDKITENNFYSTKGTANESGTGLGLMLCKDFLKKIGSRMYIESEYGKGSTFSFTLPKPVVKAKEAA
ncbi:MAG: ATP-binding protein [Chitinophagaceae bacterium]